MEDFPRKRRAVSGFMIQFAVIAVILEIPLRADQVSLQAVVTPSTTILKDGRPVTFAIHGFIEFKSLSELFPYIESQTRRWKPDRDIEGASGRIRQELLRRGIESRVVSMIDERPLEALVTHTSEELRQAISALKEPVPPGYAEAFLAVQQKWKHSLNCWSASPSIPGRVLSNWYPIEEGIRLYGAAYDSTEHFWQAVKFHPDVTVADLKALLGVVEQRDWSPWLRRLDDNPKLYLPNAYAVEFLRYNLARERLSWFRAELGRHDLRESEHARRVQQRTPPTLSQKPEKDGASGSPFRFTAFEEKVLWGDLADLFHLIFIFSAADDPMGKTLADHRFDAIYLDERKMGFISEDFRSL